MNRYIAKWFTAIDWRWKEYAILADDEASVRALIDKECPASAREKPYTGQRPAPDSLDIECVETDIKLPYVLDDGDR